MTQNLNTFSVRCGAVLAIALGLGMAGCAQDISEQNDGKVRFVAESVAEAQYISALTMADGAADARFEQMFSSKLRLSLAARLLARTSQDMHTLDDYDDDWEWDDSVWDDDDDDSFIPNTGYLSEFLEAGEGNQVNTNGTLGTTGGSQGGFGLSGGRTSGALGTPGGSGTLGALSEGGSIGSGSSGLFGACSGFSNTINVSSHNSLARLGEHASRSSLLPLITCVSAGSNPTIRLPGSGSYHVVTIAFSMGDVHRIMAGRVDFISYVWHTSTGGGSVQYAGPPLRNSGGGGFLVGIVTSGSDGFDGETYMFIAIVQ